MKRFLGVAAIVATMVASPAFAGNTTTATASVNLTINSAVTVNTVRAAINLGSIYQGTTSAAVDPATGGANAAAFSLAGPNSLPVTFSWPSSINITNGTTTATFAAGVAGNTANTQTGATSLTSGGPAVTTAASGSPVYYFWAGGTATIPSNATAGAYSGSVTITITY